VLINLVAIQTSKQPAGQHISIDLTFNLKDSVPLNPNATMMASTAIKMQHFFLCWIVLHASDDVIVSHIAVDGESQHTAVKTSLLMSLSLPTETTLVNWNNGVLDCESKW